MFQLVITSSRPLSSHYNSSELAIKNFDLTTSYLIK